MVTCDWTIGFSFVSESDDMISMIELCTKGYPRTYLL